VLLESSRRAHTGSVSEAEERVFRACNERTGAVYGPAWIVMQSGTLGAAFATGGALLARRRPCAAGVVTTAGSAVWLAAKIVKHPVGRGRPAAHLDDVTVRGAPQTGLGYPSGHAAVALTLALAAPRSRGRIVRSVALAFAAVTGAARMYVGAHLPLDVAGGLAIGALAGRVSATWVDRCPPEGRRR
jgi:undecaprenyl-diphosphatase